MSYLWLEPPFFGWKSCMHNRPATKPTAKEQHVANRSSAMHAPAGKNFIVKIWRAM